MLLSDIKRVLFACRKVPQCSFEAIGKQSKCRFSHNAMTFSMEKMSIAVQ